MPDKKIVIWSPTAQAELRAPQRQEMRGNGNSHSRGDRSLPHHRHRRRDQTPTAPHRIPPPRRRLPCPLPPHRPALYRSPSGPPSFPGLPLTSRPPRASNATFDDVNTPGLSRRERKVFNKSSHAPHRRSHRVGDDIIRPRGGGHGAGYLVSGHKRPERACSGIPPSQWPNHPPLYS